jgi:phenylalanyl-tRNA synthetase alpha subunit
MSDDVKERSDTKDVKSKLIEEASADESFEKPKRPRSEAQIKAFEKAQEMRRKNLEDKKELQKLEREVKKLDEKRKLEEYRRKLLEMKHDDEENIIVKGKPSKPKAKTNIVESDSESEEEKIEKKPKSKKVGYNMPPTPLGAPLTNLIPMRKIIFY